MRSVLITGIGGFLGANLAKRLIEEDPALNVCGLDLRFPSFEALLGRGTAQRFLARKLMMAGSVSNQHLVERAVHGNGVDVIFHLAAEAIVEQAQRDPYGCFETNIRGTYTILEAARKADVEKVIVASSDKAYGDNEVPYVETLPLKACNPYDGSKTIVEKLCEIYHCTYGLKTVITRSCNIYGPADFNWTRVVPYTVKCLLNNEPPRVWRQAANIYREYVYVDDAVDAMLLLAERVEEIQGQVYNIGTGFKATPPQIVEKIKQTLESSLMPILEDRPFKEIGDQYLDSSKIQALGWRAKTAFEEGLRKTVEWYRSHGSLAATTT